MHDAHVNKRVCFSLIALSLAHIIYRAPAGEPKTDKGRDFFFPHTAFECGSGTIQYPSDVVRLGGGAGISWSSVRKALRV